MKRRRYIQNVGQTDGDEDMELHGFGIQPAEDSLRIRPKGYAVNANNEWFQQLVDSPTERPAARGDGLTQISRELLWIFQ